MNPVEIAHLRPQITMTGAVAMCRRRKKKKTNGDEECRRISLYKINKVLDRNKLTDPEKLVRKEFNYFLLLFQETNTNRLTLYQLYDHKN